MKLQVNRCCSCTCTCATCSPLSHVVHVIPVRSIRYQPLPPGPHLSHPPPILSAVYRSLGSELLATERCRAASARAPLLLRLLLSLPPLSLFNNTAQRSNRESFRGGLNTDFPEAFSISGQTTPPACLAHTTAAAAATTTTRAAGVQSLERVNALRRFHRRHCIWSSTSRDAQKQLQQQQQRIFLLMLPFTMSSSPCLLLSRCYLVASRQEIRHSLVRPSVEKKKTKNKTTTAAHGRGSEMCGRAK